MRKNRSKHNIIFGIIFLITVICVIKKDMVFSTDVVSVPDSYISFETERNVLEQTWQAPAKQVCGIEIPYITETNFESEIQLEIYEESGKLVKRSSIVQRFTKDNPEGVLKFSFESVKVIPGERYHIQMAYMNPKEKGEIKIPAGNNYGGASIDGEELNQAVALKVFIVKYSHIFWLWAIIFPLLAFGLLLMVFFRRKWEECIGIALAAEGCLLYAFGLVERLTLGITTLYVLSVLAMLITVVLYNKKELTIKDLWSPGLLIYGILVLGIIINCNGLWFARWDEYSHWGLAVKDMFYYDTFGKHINTTLMFPRYMPFTTLIEYLFVYVNGLFSEEIVYIAYQIMLLSCIIIVSSAAKYKIKYVVPSLAVIICVPLMFYGEMADSIYVDPLLAIIVAFVLFCYFSEEVSLFNGSRILAGLFMLVAIKESGVVIAGLLTLIILSDVLLGQVLSKQLTIKRFFKHLDWKKLILPGVSVFVVCITFFSWQFYMSVPIKTIETTEKLVNIEFAGAISSSGLSWDGIVQLFSGNGEAYQYQSVKNFIKEIFDGDMFYFGSIGFSYIDIFLVIFLLAGIWGYRACRQDRIKSWTFAIFVSAAGICYAIFLGIMYLFAFTPEEAVLLSSGKRYLGAWIGGVVIAICELIVFNMSKKEKVYEHKAWYQTLILTILIGICFPMQSVIDKNNESEVTEDMVYANEGIAEIFRSFSQKGEKVYFVCSNSSGYSYHIFKNVVCPLVVADSDWNLVTSKEAWYEKEALYEGRNEEINGKTAILSAEEWKERLKTCDYVFIYHADEVFIKGYANVFEDENTITDGSFYEVLREGEELRLKYIGKTGIKSYK